MGLHTPMAGVPATASSKGVVELATTAEVVAGSDTERAVTPAGVAAALAVQAEVIIISFSDESTAFETGQAKATFHMPFAMTLSGIIATVTVAPTDATLIIDVHDGGTTIMATDKLDIETTEFSTETAGTSPVLTDTALAKDAVITIDIDQIGSSVAGAGGKVYLIGTRT